MFTELHAYSSMHLGKWKTLVVVVIHPSFSFSWRSALFLFTCLLTIRCSLQHSQLYPFHYPSEVDLWISDILSSRNMID